MGELNRQQICEALALSESTIRRLEKAGLPYTPVGPRSKRYDLDECKAWLKEHFWCPANTLVTAGNRVVLQRASNDFLASCKNIRLRVTPSEKE